VSEPAYISSSLEQHAASGRTVQHRYTVRLWLAVLLGVNLFLVAYMASLFPLTVSLLIFGMVLMYALWVPVNRLERVMRQYVLPRFPALQHRFAQQTAPHSPRLLRLFLLSLVYFVAINLLSLALTQILPTLQEEFWGFLKELPVTITSTLMQLNQWLGNLKGLHPVLDNALDRLTLLDTHSSTTVLNRQLVESVANPVLKWFEASLTHGSAFINQGITRVFWLVLLVTMVFYALLDGKELLQRGTAPLPPAWRDHTRQLLADLHRIMVAFVEGQVILGLLTGLYMFVIYSIFKVPYALLLSSVFAIAELLPVVGTYIGFTPGIFILLMSGNFVTLAIIMGLSYVWQSVKDNILQPQIFGKTLGLHPAIMLVTLILCAKLGGVLGILLAVPVSGLVVVTIKRLNTFHMPFAAPKQNAPETVLDDVHGASHPS
jgi:predicted PurR-regulated permease PerM